MHPRLILPLISFMVFLLLPAAVSGAAGQPGGVTGNHSLPWLVAQPAGQASLTLPKLLTNTFFLPVLSSVFDLSIDRLEVTQAVQTSSNSVPLVADRSTVVRVYTRVLAGSSPTPAKFMVALAGSRGGQPLPGSPLLLGPFSIVSNPSPGVYNTTVNVNLPSTWLGQGTTSLVATVDATGLAAESQETNNSASATVVFNSVPVLSIKIVPVTYTHLPTGQVYPAPTVDTISNWARRVYPVSQVTVSFRTPIPFSGDLKNSLSSWSQLLNRVGALKGTDGAPAGQVYYGFVSTRNGTGDWLGNQGTVGLGYIGFRAAVGLDLPSYPWGTDAAGQTAAHEIGHNLGRSHSPCGGASGADPAYPYTGGSVGQYGLDLSKSIVWNPDPYNASSNPYGARDLMGYCHPYWISDYTYSGLYNDQRSHGALALAGATGAGLLIRASVGEEPAVLQPVYTLSGVPAAPRAGDYTVELVDEAGRVIAVYPVAAYPVEAPIPLGGAPATLPPDTILMREITAVVPQPALAVAGVRLVQAGQVLASRSLKTLIALDTPTVTSQPDGTLLLRWSSPAPALVRYSADGVTWLTLALDAEGGELRVDPAALPDSRGRFEIAVADSNGSATVARP